MRKLFNSVFKVTQNFGVNASYYSQFGLAGHEGIDLIPSTSDWTVLATDDGEIVRDIDNAKSGAYGINCTIWHPQLKKATQFCHLEINNVTIGQKVKRGEKLGKMGATGNTSGAHVHLNLFNVDVNGVRQNTNNGYFGGIDPLPFLQENISTTPIPTPPMDDSQPRKQIITDVYRALCGVEPSPDELKFRLDSKINTYDLIRDICNGDERFKKIWVKPLPLSNDDLVAIIKSRLK